MNPSETLSPLPGATGADLSRSSAPRDIAIILVLAAMLLFPSYPFRDLWTPDEPRYFEVAREMVVTGDYLVPHLNGVIYDEKPPLFFWLAAGFCHLGFGQNSGRFVAALAGIGTLLLVYFFARRFLPAPGPLLTALLTLTTARFLESRDGLIDPLLMFFTTAAIVSGHRALQPDTRRRTLCWLAAYALTALAVLTKGPAGLAVSGLVLLTYGILDRRRVRPGTYAHLLGAAILLAIVLAWLIPAVRSGGPEYARNIGLDQTAKRIVDSSSHKAPPYFYLLQFLPSFSPWSFLLPLAAIAAIVLCVRRRDPFALFALSWFIIPFLMFSVISGKRPGYLMPIVPAAGLLLGRYFTDGLRNGFPWPRWHSALFRATFAFCGLFAAGLAAALPAFPWVTQSLLPWAVQTAQRFLPFIADPISGLADLIRNAPVQLHLNRFELVLGIAIAVAILALSVFGFLAVLRSRHRPSASSVRQAHGPSLSRAGRHEPVECRTAFYCLVAIALATTLTLDLFVAPRLNQAKSGRFFCQEAKPFLDQAAQVHLLGDDMSGVYNLYTGRLAMPVLDTPEEVANALTGGRKIAIIAREPRWQQRLTPELAGTYRIAFLRLVGDRRMILVINWDPQTGKLLPKPLAQ